MGSRPIFLPALFFVLNVAGCATKAAPDVPAEITPPHRVRQVDPEYPAELRQQGVQGDVSLETNINTDGTVADVRVLRSADPRLEPLAIAAVRQWKFTPGKLRGAPVVVKYNVVVHFGINP